MGITVFVFGNPLVRKDSLPLRLLPGLRKRFPEIDFREFDTAEDLSEMGGDVNIIDTVAGCEDAAVFSNSDLDSFRTERVCSLHDFDLAITLKLMRRMGMLKSVRIFGIPAGMPERAAFENLCGLIEANLRPTSS